MLPKFTNILAIFGLLLAIFTVSIAGGQSHKPEQEHEKSDKNVTDKNEVKLADFWNEATPEIISYFVRGKLIHQNLFTYVKFLKELEEFIKASKLANKLHEENKLPETNKLHEIVKKHTEIIHKVEEKINKEIGLEKQRKVSANREFIEIYIKVQLSKTIREQRSKILSEVKHAEAVEAKKSPQEDKKKEKHATAVDKIIRGIIIKLTLKYVSNGVFHQKLDAYKLTSIERQIGKEFDEMIKDQEHLENELADGHYDTIVVGGGIIGSGIGYKLASKYDKKTLILEKGKKGHKDGSSHGGSRILRHTHTSLTWLPMAKDAYREWNELQKEYGKQILRVNGVITLDFEKKMTETREEILKKENIEYKLLVGKEISEEFPHLKNYAKDQNEAKVEWSAIYEPGGVTLLADKCLEAIQEQFLKTHRGEINFEEEVVGWDEKNDGIWVKTNKNHRYTAKNVIFAVGGWLSKQFPDLPMKTTPYLKGSLYWDVKKEEHQEYFDPNFEAAAGQHKEDAPKHPSPSLCIWPSRDDEESMYAIPEEKSQIKFCTSYGKEIEDEIKPNKERQIPEGTITRPKEHITKHLPWVDAEKGPAKNSVTCITTVTNDGQWIVDEHPEYPGKVYIAGGFCGTGFKYALTVGNLLAQKMAGVERPKLLDDSGTHIEIDMMDKFSLKLKRRAEKPNTMVPEEE